jgi:Domain of unknown function (DUF305)
MRARVRGRLRLVGLSLVLTSVALVAAAGTVPSAPAEAAFLREMQTAMDMMMAGMGSAPSGDVDRDFASMMIPHHQGAIDMAKAELRSGHSEQLRRIAQEIIVEQQAEIAAMSLAVGLPLPPSSAATTEPANAVPAAQRTTRP